MERIIALHGAYNINNFGDILLLEIFSDWLKSKNIQIFFPKLYNERILQYSEGTTRNLTKSDYLVFFGGGYINNKAKTFKQSINRTASLYKNFYSLTHQVGQYSILGVGVGPFGNFIDQKLAAVFFANAEYVSVRDIESLEFIGNLGVDTSRIQLIPDAALTINTENFREDTIDRDYLLHVTVYTDAFLQAIKRFARENLDKTFTITTDQDTASKMNILLKYKYALYDRQNVDVAFYENPQQYLRVINNHKFILTTKFHVGITACVLNKKVAAMSWDYQKSIRFYKQISRPDICFNVNYQSERDVFEILDSLQDSKPVNIDPKIISDAFKNRDILLKKIVEG